VSQSVQYSGAFHVSDLFSAFYQLHTFFLTCAGYPLISCEDWIIDSKGKIYIPAFLVSGSAHFFFFNRFLLENWQQIFLVRARKITRRIN